jgi:DNA-binding transcriptional ArsR family regulator
MSRPRRNVAPLFAALGDETRLRLLASLSEGRPLSIARLAQGSRLTRQAITKHLHVLAHAGLARGARSGRERIWELERGRLEVARRYLDHVSRHWDDALARLKRFVEE